MRQKDNSQSQPHKQVITKVNAYVDEDIKELVEILNTLDKVWTFESCQRDGYNRGWVMLHYGDGDTGQSEVIEFATKLVASIRKHIKESEEDCPILCRTLISIEWLGDGITPYMYITFPADAHREITKVFHDAIQDFHDGNDCKCKRSYLGGIRDCQQPNDGKNSPMGLYTKGHD